jgi:hypothetical protein
MRKMMFVLAAQAVAAAAGLSAEPTRPAVAPIVPCPPTFVAPLPCPPGATPGAVMPGVPGTMPGTPGMPGTPPGTPGVPPGTPPVPDVSSPTPDTSSAFARQSEGGTQAGRSYAPNMFGDVLGARSIRLGLNTPFSITNASVGGLQQTQTGVGRSVNLNGSTIRFGGGTSGIPLESFTVNSNSDLTFVQPTSADGQTPDTNFTRNALQTLLSNGGLTPAQIASFNQLTAAQREQLLRNRGQINQTITQRTQGLAIQTLTVSPIAASLDGGFNASGQLTGEQAIPLPGGSTYVGRVKMSEDTSPLPRDRILFAYDHFDSVPFIPGGLTVNRFQFGIEKTFLDGRWSAEFRLPFAGTLASTNVQGFEVGHTELGNVRFALKRIFSQNDVFTTTSGVAVTLPTADDQVVLSSTTGRELYRFKNEQVTVEPFVAALWTPNSRLFSQTWGSINFDVSGGELSYDKQAFEGKPGVGRERIWDLPFLSVDYQIGYWLIQQDYGTLRGLAPFVELHWNYAIAQQELIREVNKRLPNRGLSVGSVADHELNLIAGVLTQVGDNLNLSIGASAPLLNRPNRTFDAQVGVRANYLFGQTARARNPINYINSY